jgi:hypothetical protein
MASGAIDLGSIPSRDIIRKFLDVIGFIRFGSDPFGFFLRAWYSYSSPDYHKLLSRLLTHQEIAVGCGKNCEYVYSADRCPNDDVPDHQKHSAKIDYDAECFTGIAQF